MMSNEPDVKKLRHSIGKAIETLGVEELQHIFKIVSELKQELSSHQASLEQEDQPKRSLWADRTTGREVTPIDWIKMHYGRIVNGEWESDGLTQADISRSDRKLYDAYIARIRRSPEEDLGLPTEPREKITDAEKALERKRKADRAYARQRREQRLAIK